MTDREEIAAAANIMDVMMGGDRSSPGTVNDVDHLDSTFLDSADWAQALAYARAALDASSAPAGDGWRLVPEDPTPAMQEAGEAAMVLAEVIDYGPDGSSIYTPTSAYMDVWEAMLAAAPRPDEAG